jgi:hypothetical protein
MEIIYVLPTPLQDAVSHVQNAPHHSLVETADATALLHDSSVLSNLKKRDYVPTVGFALQTTN